ncbi:hypothetical protein [Lysinibacillus sp. NPDC047702]|uniref:hypothetical protein n=1 Tax=unclassified Lysinibacillus TaxID=2636778 RepID=UPI003D08A1B2
MSSKGIYRQGREERVPDWFKDRHKDNSLTPPETTESDLPPMDFEAERQKILAMLGKAE